jgi:plastocyanin
MIPLLVATLLLPPSEVSGTVELAGGKPAKDAVVYLLGAEKGTPIKGAKIDQRDMKFSPHVLAVPVGTRVDFPNNDTVFHNVFSEYHSEKFDFGMYPKGQKKSQVFDRPGLAVLLCMVHPQMSAYVMCVDTPYYAVTDGKGHFRVKGSVPNGDYTLRVWHESGAELEQRVSIRGGDTLKLEIRRKR